MRKPIAIVILAVSVAAFFSACDGLLGGLSALERAAAFVVDADADPQDFDEMKSNFHPDVSTYADLQLAATWTGTFFDTLFRPFTLINSAQGSEDPLYPGSVTVTVTSRTQLNR